MLKSIRWRHVVGLLPPSRWGETWIWKLTPAERVARVAFALVYGYALGKVADGFLNGNRHRR